MHVQVLAIGSPGVGMDYKTMAPNFIYEDPEGEDIDLGLSLSNSLQQETDTHPSGRRKKPFFLVAVFLFLFSLLLSCRLFIY